MDYSATILWIISLIAALVIGRKLPFLLPDRARAADDRINMSQRSRDVIAPEWYSPFCKEDQLLEREGHPLDAPLPSATGVHALGSEAGDAAESQGGAALPAGLLDEEPGDKGEQAAQRMASAAQNTAECSKPPQLAPEVSVKPKVSIDDKAKPTGVLQPQGSFARAQQRADDGLVWEVGVLRFVNTHPPTGVGFGFIKRPADVLAHIAQASGQRSGEGGEQAGVGPPSSRRGAGAGPGIVSEDVRSLYFSVSDLADPSLAHRLTRGEALAYAILPPGDQCVAVQVDVRGPGSRPLRSKAGAVCGVYSRGRPTWISVAPHPSRPKAVAVQPVKAAQVDKAEPSSITSSGRRGRADTATPCTSVAGSLPAPAEEAAWVDVVPHRKKGGTAGGGAPVHGRLPHPHPHTRSASPSPPATSRTPPSSYARVVAPHVVGRGGYARTPPIHVQAITPQAFTPGVAPPLPMGIGTAPARSEGGPRVGDAPPLLTPLPPLFGACPHLTPSFATGGQGQGQARRLEPLPHMYPPAPYPPAVGGYGFGWDTSLGERLLAQVRELDPLGMATGAGRNGGGAHGVPQRLPGLDLPSTLWDGLSRKGEGGAPFRPMLGIGGGGTGQLPGPALPRKQ